MIDSWQEILGTLSRNKLRALLTACGVAWGIFSLVIMLGLGNGLERGAHKNFGEMVTPSVFVWSQRTTLPYRGLKPGRHPRFENDDIAAIARVPGIAEVAPRLQLGGWRDGQNVVAGTKTGNFTIMGDLPAFRRIEPFSVKRGRFLNPIDQEQARKVAILGDQARSVLFGEENPVGQSITIKGVHFLVVGEIASDKGGDDGERIGATVFIPFSTFQAAFNQRNRVGWFALTATSGANAPALEAAVKRLLARRHEVHPDDPQAIGSFNAAEKMEQVNGLFRGIRRFVWLVGTLTLLAGVLGVSNILMITVKERTREIGVRKALGATPWSILSMVLKEALALTSLSGYLGLVVAVATLEALSRAVQKLEDAPLSRPDVDVGVALSALAILIVSGLVAGIVPARHATRISPVEALRAE